MEAKFDHDQNIGNIVLTENIPVVVSQNQVEVEVKIEVGIVPATSERKHTQADQR